MDLRDVVEHSWNDCVLPEQNGPKREMIDLSGGLNHYQVSLFLLLIRQHH